MQQVTPLKYHQKLRKLAKKIVSTRVNNEHVDNNVEGRKGGHPPQHVGMQFSEPLGRKCNGCLLNA